MSARIFSRHGPGWVVKGKHGPLNTAAAALPTVKKIEAELAEVPDGAPRAPRKKQ
jgi:hypothetical protein